MTTRNENALRNTTWDNSNIYKSFEDPRLMEDLEALAVEASRFKDESGLFEEWVKKLEAQVEPDTDILNRAISLKKRELDSYIVLRSAQTFIHCALSVNAKDERAKEIDGKLGSTFINMMKALKPLNVFLQRAPESFIESYLKDPAVKETAFLLHHGRKLKIHGLPLGEEILESGLSQDGLKAWGDLYNSIAGTIEVEIEENNGAKKMGLAEASALLRQGNRELREKSWKAINKAWGLHEESAAAILNSINGWRLEMNKARSHSKELHYLDVSCHQSRISRETLNALMKVTYDRREVGQRALKSMAKLMDIKKLAPWDILAPAPLKNKDDGGNAIPFDEAIDLIATAFNELNPEMGKFAKMMAEKGWIDSKPSANRGSGAYCTKFAKTREPRVFMTYTGSLGNVITLAHELGHAYHNWVMKDLPFMETAYSMTLAETASIFAETLVKKSVLSKCKTKEEKLGILWQDAESAGALLINIPARFEFEKDLVEGRKERPQSAGEMKKIMSNAWEKWYGDTLTEYDSMFWASKMHFSIAGLGFYNYPYLFGYLFSLGIYGQKEKLGDKFNDLYLDILKDTGTMTAEDLIQKHLGKDIREEDFWHTSLNIVEEQIQTFEELVGE